MKYLLKDHFTFAWLLLIAVTLMSSRIGGPDSLSWFGSAGTVSLAVLLIAMGKVAVVIFTFMEVRSAPMVLKAACSVWLVVVTGVLLALYFGVML